MPAGYPVGAKRLCQSDDYFAMFNLPTVTLVDIRSAPIESVYAGGLRTADSFYELDALVFATGFDAISGALDGIDVRGVGGVPLTEKWAAGPRAYLGVAAAGFPNMFLVTGPGSPSVFSNMVLSIEQHVEWIRDCVVYLRSHGYSTAEAKPSAEDAWMAHVTEVAYSTLFPLADSVVRRSEHPRQAAGVHAVPGRRRAVPGAMRRGGGGGLRGVRARLAWA